MTHQQQHYPRAQGAYFPTQQPVGAYFPHQPPSLGNASSPDLRPLATTASVVWLISRGVGGFLVGRAIAPDREAMGTYGWVGALVGTFAGPIGLGVMGLVAMEAKS